MSLDVVRETQQILLDGGGTMFDVLPAAIKRLIQDKAWLHQPRYKSEDCFSSFEELVTDTTIRGLNTTISDLLYFCRNAPDVQKMIKAEIGEAKTHSEAGSMGGRGNKADSNTTSFNQDRGQSYNIKRLKRDRPDLAEQVVNGELTANAAAVIAGFRKQTKSIPINTPSEAINALLRVFDADTLMAALIDQERRAS